MKIYDLIQRFQMEPHPEGGYFRETYRSPGLIKQSASTEKLSGDRSFSTAIYFLLPAGKKSHLHRIASDEMWHFYLGGPMTLMQISPEGEVQKITLGQDLAAGQLVQYVVPRGCWFGSYPNPGTEYSFVGCTVAPGFDFSDFEMGKRDELIELYPHAKKEICELTES